MPIDKLSGNSFATGAVSNSLGYTPLSAAAPTAVANGTANVAFFAANGNIGIGTSSPNFKLDVDGQVEIQASSSGRYFQLINDSTASYLDTSHALNLRVNGAASLRTAATITNTGSIGVGITTPGSILQLNSTAAMGTGSATDHILTITNNNGVVSGVAGDKFGILMSAHSDLSDRRIGLYTVSGNPNYNNPDFAIFQTGQGIALRETFRITADSSATLRFNSGYGSVAAAYGCRAWVNFNAASGTPVIQASGNISSIGDRGTGQFTIFFTNAMPDANYVLLGSVESQTGWQGVTQYSDEGGGSPATLSNKSTTQCMIVTTYSTPSDFAEISVAFIR